MDLNCYKNEGSLPPTRGTHIKLEMVVGQLRITPAYAGNTAGLGECDCCPEDHSRLRGEHKIIIVKQKYMIGSLPPTRGTRIVSGKMSSRDRITPAYAGNTHGCFSDCSTVKDHSRLRGEHRSQIHHGSPLKGSLPPTRGTLKTTVTTIVNARITPAYAGNTIFCYFHCSFFEDHSRLRGEHAVPVGSLRNASGSLPPTRGTHKIADYYQQAWRITPAYAGNTRMVLSAVHIRQDHSRLRGEHPLLYSS